MFVDVSKHNRQTLTTEEKEFFELVVPIGRYISEQTRGKAELLRQMRNVVGIRSSLVIADILQASNFGTHPVSTKRYDNRPGNNLALLEPGKYWYGPIIYYKGKEYRSYKELRAYMIDHSDLIALSRSFDNLLCESDLEAQINAYVKNKGAARGYHARIKTVIELYNLTEFDTWPEKRKQTPVR